ncbi:MAG TPA: glycosyltransferase family 4 protein, partial [Streptosporangiaceae bacterium]
PINGHLLCVAALAPHKAQDLLIRALANLPDLPWDCTLVGPLDRDPDFVTRLRTAITQAALTPRVHLTGPLTAEPLNRAYAAADLLVVPSRADTYGMVVTEALAHALPVLTTTAGGLPEALGHTPHGTRPGHLIPPEDPKALTAALEKWLTNAPHRTHLRKAAADRRPTLPTWPQTTQAVATALTAAARDVTR